MKLKTLAGAVAALLVIGCGGQASDVGAARSPITTTPEAVYHGVKHCAEVARALGIPGTFAETTINPNETLLSQDWPLEGGGTFTIDFLDATPYTVFDWSADAGVRLVLVYYWVADNQPGDTAAYVYDPTTTTGSTIATPVGPQGAPNVDIIKVCQLPPEQEGCTLTQGYWKTHAEGKKFDATWNEVGGPGEKFFGTDATWLEVFNTPPAGNAYYQLAHQYMAAKLNFYAGASVGDLGTALADAEAFFNAFKPTDELTKAKRAEIIALAGVLGSFNEGDIGPGHCAE